MRIRACCWAGAVAIVLVGCLAGVSVVGTECRVMSSEEMADVKAGQTQSCCGNKKVLESTCWESTNGRCTGLPEANCSEPCGEDYCSSLTKIYICIDWPDHPDDGCKLVLTNPPTNCGDRYQGGKCTWDGYLGQMRCMCVGGTLVIGGCANWPSAQWCNPTP